MACYHFQCYMHQFTFGIKFPCGTCPNWVEKVDYNLLKKAQEKYDAVKACNPIKTTAKPGYDIHALVKAKFPELYKQNALSLFNWDDLDGVLDHLYGHMLVFGAVELKAMIDFIEVHCEGY